MATCTGTACKVQVQADNTNVSQHGVPTLQGEPHFDQLKRDLEDVKNQPRSQEGTFRTAAERERRRAQLADAAIEEQLEVQTAFREQGARLQVCPSFLRCLAGFVLCPTLLAALTCWRCSRRWLGI